MGFYWESVGSSPVSGHALSGPVQSGREPSHVDLHVVTTLSWSVSGYDEVGGMRGKSLTHSHLHEDWHMVK